MSGREHGHRQPRRRLPRAHRAGAASSTAPSAASSRSPGAEAKEFLHGQVTNDIEALEPGRGCYAAFLTHKGKMLGDLRVLDLGDELFLDTERSALQELFNMIRRYKLGPRRRAAQAHASSARCCRWWARRAPRRRRPAEHDNARDEIGGVPVTLVATDVGVDVICDAERAARSRPRSACPRSTRRPRRSCASSPGARATASTSTTP